MPKYTPFMRNVVKSENIDITGYIPKYNISEELKTSKDTTAEVEEVNTSSTEPVKTEIVTSPIKEIRESVEPKPFKEQMLELYSATLKKYGLNPLFAKSLVAQDSLESNHYKKPTGKNNFGGIKGQGSKIKTYEYINGKKVNITDSFRDFETIKDYVEYKIRLLNSSRYKAFSGKVSEFADRVAAGGYATDPKYKEKLNRIISESLQQGGVLEAKEWIKEWLTTRKDILHDNLNFNYSIPVPKNLAHKVTQFNIDSARVSINPEKLQGAKGAYYPNSHRIVLKDDNPSSAVHEYTHSTVPVGQTAQIKKIKDSMGRAIFNSYKIQEDEYWDSPDEIYSRIMQVRHFLNADPNHKFTEEEVENLVDKYINKMTLRNVDRHNSHFGETVFNNEGEIIDATNIAIGDPDKAILNIEHNHDNAFSIFDRYSPKFITRVLNEVAQTNTQVKPHV